MNILIPMAGRGVRFSNKGYELPKPLIQIKEKPLIQHAIDTLDLDGRYIFVIQKSHREIYNIDSLLKQITDKPSIIEIDGITDGPACSALLAKEYIDNDDELVIANCDQIMNWNSDIFLHNVRLYDGAVVTYHETSNKNSYAKIDKNGFVERIVEKEVISNISLNGIHYWKKGKYFITSSEQMISENCRFNKEFYIGPSYNYMILNNLKVGIFHIPNEQHNAVGIPEDLERYLHYGYKEN
jgi:dTDP-glucose pyrophosphorylase